MSSDLVVVGNGRHSTVLKSVYSAKLHNARCVVDADMKRSDHELYVWAIGDQKARENIVTQKPWALFATLHSLTLDDDSMPVLGEGTVVMQQCLFEPKVVVGRHCLINTRVQIHHDCRIGDFVNIGPGAILLGGVHVESGVMIGAGSIVRENVRVAATVGMGSVVTKNVHRLSWGRPAAPSYQPWCWYKPIDFIHMKRLLGHNQRYSNGGPLVTRLAQEIPIRFRSTSMEAIPVSSGTAALHLMVAIQLELNVDLSRGIAVSAFGFPSVLQGNWRSLVKICDMDPVHGGPLLSEGKDATPAVVCLTNPFGYVVDLSYYREYCRAHNCQLWMDNAATPLALSMDGRNVCDLADATMVSLHETKPLGRGEGGLLLVPTKLASVARRLINFGFSEDRQRISVHGNNWKMSDFAAAAILTHWHSSWERIVAYNRANWDQVRAVPPFQKPTSSLMSCLFEHRQERPHKEVHYYYTPLDNRKICPNAWAFYDAHQCVPFHDNNNHVH